MITFELFFPSILNVQFLLDFFHSAIFRREMYSLKRTVIAPIHSNFRFCFRNRINSSLCLFNSFCLENHLLLISLCKRKNIKKKLVKHKLKMTANPSVKTTFTLLIFNLNPASIWYFACFPVSNSFFGFILNDNLS